MTKHLYIYFRDGSMAHFDVSKEWRCIEQVNSEKNVLGISLIKENETRFYPVWGIREYHFVNKDRD